MSKSEVTYIYWNGILLCSKDQAWLRNHFLIETKQKEWRTSRNVYSQQMLHSILSFVETPSLERNCLKVALTLSFDCLSWASCVISLFASCPLVELDERRPNILYFLKIPKHFTRKKNYYLQFTFVYKRRLCEHLILCWLATGLWPESLMLSLLSLLDLGQCCCPVSCVMQVNHCHA